MCCFFSCFISLPEAQQQQQQDDDIHYRVARCIEISKQHHPDWVDISCDPDREPVNLPSVRYLVDHLQGDDGGQHVTGLRLHSVRLSSPSDGGLDVLSNLFESTTRLTKVELGRCDFGGPAAGTRVLESFHNSSVSDLTISGLCNLEGALEGAALGTGLSHLLQNNPTLQRLELFYCTSFRVEGVRALQRGIRSNQSLTELLLIGCPIGNEGLGLIADSLIGNTTLRVLGVSGNEFTPNGIGHIMSRLRSTRLQWIDLYSTSLFDAQSLQRLRDELVHNPHLLRFELGDAIGYRFPETIAEIETLLAQNRDWPSVRQTSADQADALLARQPPNNTVIGDNSTVLFKAIVNLAARRCNSGASGIYIILRSRPGFWLSSEPPAQENNGDDFAAVEQGDEEELLQEQPEVAVAVQEQVEVGGGDDREDDATEEGLDPGSAAVAHHAQQGGADRAAFTLARTRLAEYEQRMEEATSMDTAQQDEQHAEQPQQESLQAAARAGAAGYRQANEVDDMNNNNNNNHDDDSSSNNRKHQH